MTNGDTLARRNNSKASLRQSGSQQSMISDGNRNMIPSQGLRKRDSSAKFPSVGKNHVTATSQNRDWVRHLLFRHKYSRPMIFALLLFVNIHIYFRLKGNGISEKVYSSPVPKTTIVLMGYTMKRVDNYERILPAYGAMDKALDRVIFLWNNKEDGPPPIPKGTAVPFDVLVQSENSMNNRFGPDVSDNTKTDTVMMIDDDILMSEELILKMLRAYYNNENSQINTTNTTIIGISNDARIASYDQGYIFPCWRIEGYIFSTACYKSPFSKLPPTNVVIGKTMLFHKKWLLAYQSDADLWSYTGEQKHFCEDILMNALIRNSTNHPTNPIFVDKDRYSTRLILQEGGGLSSHGITAIKYAFQWAAKRTECVRWGVDHFGRDIWK